MASQPPKICLVAVDVRSSHNVGSFFRTCDGFGVELCLVGITPRPNYAGDERLPHVAKKAEMAIAKTAIGAEKTVTWRYFETLEECISYLKNSGHDVFAVEQTAGSKNLTELKVSKNTALVVGREVEGLSEPEIKMCDRSFEIPMKGSKESFNVAVCAGIALYQATQSL